MNAIPPGGLTPEEPLTRPSAARRGAKAAEADKVSLMVALEDEPDENDRGAVLLEDAADGPAPAPGATAGISEASVEQGDSRILALAGQPKDRARTGQDTGTSPDGPANTSFPEQPGWAAERSTRPEPYATPGQHAPAPAEASEGEEQTARAHDNQSRLRQRHGATDLRQEQAPGHARGAVQGAASSQPDIDQPNPWNTPRPGPEDQPATGGWDRPPPPPRSAPRANPLPAASLGMPVQLTGIEVTLSVEIGSHRLSLRELLSVEPGQLVPLDRMTSEPVDILVNGKPFARGEVVAIGDRFGVRLTGLVDGSDAG